MDWEKLYTDTTGRCPTEEEEDYNYSTAYVDWLEKKLDILIEEKQEDEKSIRKS